MGHGGVNAVHPASLETSGEELRDSPQPRYVSYCPKGRHVKTLTLGCTVIRWIVKTLKRSRPVSLVTIHLLGVHEKMIHRELHITYHCVHRVWRAAIYAHAW